MNVDIPTPGRPGSMHRACFHRSCIRSATRRIRVTTGSVPATWLVCDDHEPALLALAESGDVVEWGDIDGRLTPWAPGMVRVIDHPADREQPAGHHPPGVSDELARELHVKRKAGLSRAKCAALAGCSESAVTNAWLRLGLPTAMTKPRTAAEVIRIARETWARSDGGRRIGVLAREVGVAPSTLRKWWRAAGLR